MKFREIELVVKIPYKEIPGNMISLLDSTNIYSTFFTKSYKTQKNSSFNEDIISLLITKPGKVKTRKQATY